MYIDTLDKSNIQTLRKPSFAVYSEENMEF